MSAVFRFSQLLPVDPIPEFKPKHWRRDAVLQLWLAGWSLRDVARLSGLGLVACARIVGSRTRQADKSVSRSEKDAENDPLDTLRKGRAGKVPLCLNE